MAGIEKHTRQDEHDEPENLVEAPGEAERAARSLEDEVDSNATLEGYFAMNNVRDAQVQEALDLEKKGKPPSQSEK